MDLQTEAKDSENSYQTNKSSSWVMTHKTRLSGRFWPNNKRRHFSGLQATFTRLLVFPGALIILTQVLLATFAATRSFSHSSILALSFGPIAIICCMVWLKSSVKYPKIWAANTTNLPELTLRATVRESSSQNSFLKQWLHALTLTSSQPSVLTYCALLLNGRSYGPENRITATQTSGQCFIWSANESL